MPEDTIMHEEQQSNNKRTIAEVEEGEIGEGESEVHPSKRIGTETQSVGRLEPPADLAMTEADETERRLENSKNLKNLGKLGFRRPSEHERAFEVTGPSATFYLSGLALEEPKEGLALAPYHHAPWSDEMTEESAAARRAEIIGAIATMRDGVDELAESLRKYSKTKFSRDDLLEKLTYMLGAAWQSFMGVDFPGSGPSGHGVLQCFSCYQALVSS